MTNRRHDRIQQLIKQLASNIILYELKDPRMGFVTISRVDLSSDLRFAKVFYSVLGSDVDMQQTARTIQHARGHIQRQIAKQIRLRFAPEISFEFDDSPRKSIELSQIIDEAVAEDEERKNQHPSDDEDQPAEDEPEAGEPGHEEPGQ